MLTSVLSQDQIGKIDRASIRILEKVGVELPHDEVLGRFEEAGARVDRTAKRVRIPEKVVRGLLGKAGRSFSIHGRDASKIAAFGAGKRNYNSIAGEAYWVENPGEQRRFASLADVAAAARVADALPSISIAGAMSDPHEMPVEWRCVEVAATLLKNTTKPVGLWFHDRASAKYLCDLLVALRGDEKRAAAQPAYYPFLEPISPLRFPFNGVDLIFETARLNLAVPVGPMAQTGVSAPATVAGTIAQENAEILAGICVTQLINPGNPMCYGGICHAFDMAKSQLIFSGPEQAIFGVAHTQMGKFYGLPVYINVGLTDSKRPDAQAGLEAGVTLACGAAAGADIFGHMGISGVDQASSLDMLVLQDEVIAYVESCLRTIELSDEIFGFDAIEEVGPGGTFIDHEHTIAHFRREMWVPRILDRDYYQQWLDGGAVSTEQRCRRRKEEILRSHRPEPIAPDLARRLDEVVAAAKAHLSGR